nr:unnamed protein product [Callosobruchus chinensis]
MDYLLNNAEKWDMGSYKPIFMASYVNKLHFSKSAPTLAHIKQKNVLFQYTSGQKDGKGYKCVEIFVDLSKVFDLVNNNLLIKKLESYRIRGNALCWFCNYLCGRKQHVQIEDSQSNKTADDIGEPQGSILGPLLYIIFVNDPNSVVYALLLKLCT